MLDSIWMIIAIPLGFLLKFCYLFFNDVLHLPLSYMLALLLFTLVTQALLFPFALKQQRTTAIATAYKPMIDEINRKYADDKKRQGEELAKLEKEFGYKPAAGCFPLLLQFPIIFGLIEIITKPLSYMLRLSGEFIGELKTVTASLVTDVAGLSAAEGAEKISLALSGRGIETQIIEQVKMNAGAFSGIIEKNPGWAGEMKQIVDLNMSIGPIHLYETPRLEWSWMILLPILSVVLMVLSSYLSMKNSSGFQERNSVRSGILLMVVSCAMFAWFSFTFPSGFSLYWAFSNLLVIAQSFLLKKVCNADKIIAGEQEKIDAKKQAEIDARKVEVVKEDGTVEVKELSDEELAEIRLEKARARDAERFGLDPKNEV